MLCFSFDRATIFSRNFQLALVVAFHDLLNLINQLNRHHHIAFLRNQKVTQDLQLNNVVCADDVVDRLINIFFPRSPLHDGAVIIRGNQIVAAGCYLPLTDDPYLNKELGARHRAGLGITEQSDAVAVIVSEETGIVSVAQNGILTRYLDEKKLRNVLIELCAPPKSEGINLNFWPWRNNR